MSKNNKRLGVIGEELTAKYLERKNYEIIARNWHCRYGEIDIVARDAGGKYIFVEVKTRSSNLCGSPFEAVTGTKKIHILRSAEKYLQDIDVCDDAIRIDAMALYISGNNRVKFEYIENIW